MTETNIRFVREIIKYKNKGIWDKIFPTPDRILDHLEYFDGTEWKWVPVETNITHVDE